MIIEGGCDKESFFKLYFCLFDTFTISITLFYNKSMIYRSRGLEFLRYKMAAKVLFMFICVP